MGRDPAVSSPIIVTFLTDFVGFFALLAIAAVILLWGGIRRRLRPYICAARSLRTRDVPLWVRNEMKLRNGVSPAAIELIKRFEGLRRTAAPLDDGRWTVGYAHTRSAREGAEVNEADAEALLGYDLVEVQAAVNDWTFTPLTQNQFDALALVSSSTSGWTRFALRSCCAGSMKARCCRPPALEMWRKADFEGERIVVDALVRRRAAEKALFLTPEEGFVAAPSAVVQPKMDYDVGSRGPSRAPDRIAGRPGQRRGQHRVRSHGGQ